MLISFREDFLPAVEGWKRELPSILRNRLRLLPMSAEQAFEAIHTTAPHLVDESLARRIVHFVTAQEDGFGGALGTLESVSELAVEPALLSLVCRGLNKMRKARREAVFDEELLRDKPRSIISDYYTNAVADLPERVRLFIEKELITERGFRKPCDVDDARSVYGMKDQELQLLVNRRLLRIEPHHPGDRVELTHDLLTPTVREHRDRHRERERARETWRRRGLGILGIILVVFLGLAVAFERAWSEAKREAAIAHSGRLAMAALVNRESQLDLASLLSAEAYNLQDTFEARNALLSTLQSNPSLRTYLHHPKAVNSVAFSPDGKILASASDDQTVWLWNLESRQPLGESLKGHGSPVNSVAFSPDGRCWPRRCGPDGPAVGRGDRRALGRAPLQGHTAG